MLETVQGEGGFIPMPPDYLPRLAELCERHGILFVADEVQSGVGRTGPMWAIEHYDGVEPDLLVSGKSLGGGLPLAAVTGRAEVMDAPEPGGLGGTFGGNPVACAAAAVVLDTVAEPAFRARADELGVRSRSGSTISLHATSRSARCAASARCWRSSCASRARICAQAVDGCGVRAWPAPARVRSYGNVLRLLPPLTSPTRSSTAALGCWRSRLRAAG